MPIKKSKKAEGKELMVQQPPPCSEGNLEEVMLENNYYYYNDIKNKANTPILRKIVEWEKKYKNASSNMGKWYCQIMINRLKMKLQSYK